MTEARRTEVEVETRPLEDGGGSSRTQETEDREMRRARGAGGISRPVQNRVPPTTKTRPRHQPSTSQAAAGPVPRCCCSGPCSLIESIYEQT